MCFGHDTDLQKVQLLYLLQREGGGGKGGSQDERIKMIIEMVYTYSIMERR